MFNLLSTSKIPPQCFEAHFKIFKLVLGHAAKITRINRIAMFTIISIPVLISHCIHGKKKACSQADFLLKDFDIFLVFENHQTGLIQ
jgi:hypothetical protein